MAKQSLTADSLVRTLWQYCNVLRDDGLSYPDYVEQLTYLLFLKMADELGEGQIPRELSWQSLQALPSQAMHDHYSAILSSLGDRAGMLGMIFRNAKNKIRDPAKLRILVADLIGRIDWADVAADVKGDAYEGLLEKNARDTKSGAGQYFTPRALIEAMVSCVAPASGEVVFDPACGTGGFLLAAHEYVRQHNPGLTKKQRDHLRTRAFRGVELVEEVARLAAMNLLLHGIGGRANDDLPIASYDSLASEPLERVDVVLANPPFGTKRSVARRDLDSQPTGELSVRRADFWVRTSNKQLNFIQHIVALLKPGGRAAVVVPDNVLFEGAAAASIRRGLFAQADVHTLLRLPAGLFYASGVQANVLFFDKAVASRGKVWLYDLRSQRRYSRKANPLMREDLNEFVSLFRPGDRDGRIEIPSAHGRWGSFEHEDILASPTCKLDLELAPSPSLPGNDALERLDELTRLIEIDLSTALAEIRQLAGRS